MAVERKGPLDRFLSLFTEVRGGEGWSALLLALNLFVLLGSYYLLKTVRESLVLGEKGAEVKSYAAAGQAILLLLLLPFFGYLASRVNRFRLIASVTGFFILHLGLFYLMGNSGTQIGVPFYIWLGIFNTLVIAQFWGFANDLYTEADGKRIFPIVGVGAAAGAWTGARFAGKLFDGIGPYPVMLVAALGLLLCVGISFAINVRERRSGHDRRSRDARQPLGPAGALRLIRSQRYLMLIAIMTVLLNLSNSTGEYLLGRLVAEHAKAAASSPEQAKQIIAEVYSSFFSWVNLLGFLLQAFVVSRLFRAIGIRGTLFVLPGIALFSYTIMALRPVLGVVRIGKILENSADYSIQNTTRHSLFLLTSREAKYKAQAAIDTFFWRLGDVLQAVLVFAGSSLGWSARAFAGFNLVVILAWIGTVAAIYREHKRLSRQAEFELAA